MTTLLSLLAALTQLAPASPAPTWNPSVQRTFKPGDAFVDEVTEQERAISHVDAPGHPTYDRTRTKKNHWQLRVEVEDAPGGDLGRVRVQVLQWAFQSDDQPEDLCLESRTLHIDTRTHELVVEGGQANLSGAAKAWLGALQLGREVVADATVLLPRAPVAAQGTWTPDTPQAARAVTEGAIDPSRSSGEGAVTRLWTQDGVRMGHVESSVTLQLINVPGQQLPWREGGDVHFKLSEDRSLEPGTRDVQSGTVRFSLKGGAAASKGRRLDSSSGGSCIEQSTSMVPSARASTAARRSSSPRSGGVSLKKLR